MVLAVDREIINATLPRTIDVKPAPRSFRYEFERPRTVRRIETNDSAIPVPRNLIARRLNGNADSEQYSRNKNQRGEASRHVPGFFNPRSCSSFLDNFQAGIADSGRAICIVNTWSTATIPLGASIFKQAEGQRLRRGERNRWDNKRNRRSFFRSPRALGANREQT